MTKMTKITKTTFKSFLRKNAGNLYILRKSSFSGMTDCVEQLENSGFAPCEATERFIENSFGISGLWLVNGGGDYFTEYNSGQFSGFEVSNCCGNAIIAKRG